MEIPHKLFMVLLGCKPEGRYTEQHDVFFGIAASMEELIPQFEAFWPGAKGKLHIDAWREVAFADGYSIRVVPKSGMQSGKKLFFLNLGGYKPGEFEEFHYKVLAVADTLAEAQKKAKETHFYKHAGFSGAVSHIDDKYGIDVDDAFAVEDILAAELKEKYELQLMEITAPEDTFHIGYLNLSKIKDF